MAMARARLSPARAGLNFSSTRPGGSHDPVKLNGGLGQVGLAQITSRLVGDAVLDRTPPLARRPQPRASLGKE